MDRKTDRQAGEEDAGPNRSRPAEAAGERIDIQIPREDQNN
jgi:hypothetical protein